MPTALTVTLKHRARWLAVALICLVFAQTLGALHRVVHAGGVTGASVSTTLAPNFESVRSAEFAGVSLDFEALFVGHADHEVCDQFDQLSHADLLSGSHAPIALPLTGDMSTVAHPGWNLAEQAAGFLARGPPRAV